MRTMRLREGGVGRRAVGWLAGRRWLWLAGPGAPRCAAHRHIFLNAVFCRVAAEDQTDLLHASEGEPQIGLFFIHSLFFKYILVTVNIFKHL